LNDNYLPALKGPVGRLSKGAKISRLQDISAVESEVSTATPWLNPRRSRPPSRLGGRRLQSEPEKVGVGR